jgi:hypothetical protein
MFTEQKNTLLYRKITPVFLSIIFCSLLLFTTPLKAQYYASFALGIAKIGEEESSLDIIQDRPDGTPGTYCSLFWCFYDSGKNISKLQASGKSSSDNALAFSVSIGKWQKARPWHGFSLDVSAYEFEQNQSLTPNTASGEPQIMLNSKSQLVNASLMYNLRYRFQADQQFGEGRYEAYAGLKLVGLHYIDVEFNSAIDNFKRSEISDSQSSGPNTPEIKLGIKWRYNTDIDLFLEYRYSEIDLELDGETSNSNSPDEETLMVVKSKIEPSIQQVYAGISYRF